MCLDCSLYGYALKENHEHAVCRNTEKAAVSGFDFEADSESHSALTNIRQRLELMCGGKMDIETRDGGGTVVMVTIPDHGPSGSAHEE